VKRTAPRDHEGTVLRPRSVALAQTANARQRYVRWRYSSGGKIKKRCGDIGMPGMFDSGATSLLVRRLMAVGPLMMQDAACMYRIHTRRRVVGDTCALITVAREGDGVG